MVKSKSRAINLLAVLLLISLVLAVALSATGYLDPIKEGELIWQGSPGSLQIAPGSTEVRWLYDDLNQSPVAFRLSASLSAGEADSAYGLLLGQEDGAIAVLLSPLGYAAVSQQPYPANSGAKNFYLPWQTWPHVRRGEQENELYVVQDGNTLTVRVNREWLWEAQGIERITRMGIIGESFNDAAAVGFHSADISAPTSSE